MSDQLEEREKDEVISLLERQVEVERKLISLYSEAETSIKSMAVKRLLHMIQLDSTKHVDICQLIVEVLKGEDVLAEQKNEVLKGLQLHIDLEKDALDKARYIADSTWIRETKGLKELVRKWRDDEKEHNKWLKELMGRTFFRVSDQIVELLKTPEDLEDRYVKYERKKKSTE